MFENVQPAVLNKLFLKRMCHTEKNVSDQLNHGQFTKRLHGSSMLNIVDLKRNHFEKDVCETYIYANGSSG